MTENNFYPEGSFSAIGAPFDPFGREDEYGAMNARIMPFQFSYPDYPMGFSLIRNVEMKSSDKEET